MSKDSFVFRRDWFEAIREFDDHTRLEILDALLNKVFVGDEFELSMEARIAMRFISPSIERDMERYNQICESRKAFGRKGGVAKASKSYQKLPKASKSYQNVANVANVADNDIQDTKVSMSISNNKDKDKEDTNVSKKKETDALFEECWILYRRKGSKKKSLEYWNKLSDEEKKNIPSHIKSYVGSREMQYQKDFERYLRDKVFNTIVTQGNQTIYDPDMFVIPEEYKPMTDSFFQTWDSVNKCLRFNGDIDHLNDGYTADNRPDGAKVAWGMYEWIWNANIKQWVKQ